jgi:predicted XRE-type DNA-binding protein
MTKHEPFDFEAERAMFCGMLRDPQCIEAAVSIAGPSDFSKAHAPICLRILDLFQAGGNPDIITVTHALREHGELDAVGGPVYIAGLLDMGVTGSNVRAYAELVRKAADIRRAKESIKTALLKASNGNGGDPYDSIRTLISELEQITPQATKSVHAFEQGVNDRYKLSIPEARITIEVDRLRRESNELIGELCVRCALAGMPTYDGALSIADFNLSSARARTERAKLLTTRSSSKELDWAGYLEEFCQRVLSTERSGQPAVDLRGIERPGADDSIYAAGLKLPRRHATILFGDGGAAKSYTGLYLAGRLVEQGLAVGLFDWELAGEDHRDRLERLFGKLMPKISYAHCERPLVYEVDRLARICRDNRIDYAIYDSVAFACDGPPESAEIAGRYFRAVRQIGIGSFHIAHITKSEGGDQKPFGSVFWHNGARSTYYVKLSDSSPDGKTLSIGLFNRKSNLGGIHPPTGFTITFSENQTSFTKSDPADTPELAENMSIRQRMNHLLHQGALPLDQVADALGAKPDTVRRTVGRYKNQFTILDGGKVALLQRVS